MEELGECIVVQAEPFGRTPCSSVAFGQLGVIALQALCRKVKKTWEMMDGAGNEGCGTCSEGWSEEIRGLFSTLKDGKFRCGSRCYRGEARALCFGCRLESGGEGRFAVFEVGQESVSESDLQWGEVRMAGESAHEPWVTEERGGVYSGLEDQGFCLELEWFG